MNTPATGTGLNVNTRWYPLILGLLFLIALGARAIGFGGAVTEDEDQWIARSGTFAKGLASGDWRRTYLTGHPGVTVMWLTSLTLGLDRAMPFDHPVGAPDVTIQADFLPALDRARVPFAVLQAGLVVVAAALAARLLGPLTGLLGGLVLATEPFWASVGPVVGMDGLLTGLLTVSLLAMLLGAGLGIESGTTLRWRLGWATLSGLAFGLAFLSKTTVLLAGPVFAALALLAAWNARQRAKDRSWWMVPLVLGGAWAVAAGLTCWLLWPAAWTTPVGTAVRAITFSARLGGTPHAPGNFLLGEPVEDPGAVFYPVALMLRLGPGTTIGLMLLFLCGAPKAARPVTWALLGYVLLFVTLLALAPKKVDRYLLPILPALGLLAAIGWTEAARYVPGLISRIRRTGRTDAGAMNCAPTIGCAAKVGAQFIAPSPIAPSPIAPRTSNAPTPIAPLILIALLAFCLQVWPLLQAGRYPLAAYNPLVGGVRAAERAIPVGWGDGLDVAGDQIREMAGGRTVVTSIWGPLRVSFGAHAPGPVVSEREIGQADFYVDYIHARQRRLTPRQLVSRKPDAVVTIGGVDYARVYRLR